MRKEKALQFLLSVLPLAGLLLFTGAGVSSGKTVDFQVMLNGVNYLDSTKKPAIKTTIPPGWDSIWHPMSRFSLDYSYIARFGVVRNGSLVRLPDVNFTVCSKEKIYGWMQIPTAEWRGTAGGQLSTPLAYIDNKFDWKNRDGCLASNFSSSYFNGDFKLYAPAIMKRPEVELAGTGFTCSKDQCDAPTTPGEYALTLTAKPTEARQHYWQWVDPAHYWQLDTYIPGTCSVDWICNYQCGSLFGGTADPDCAHCKSGDVAIRNCKPEDEDLTAYRKAKGCHPLNKIGVNCRKEQLNFSYGGVSFPHTEIVCDNGYREMQPLVEAVAQIPQWSTDGQQGNPAPAKIKVVSCDNCGDDGVCNKNCPYDPDCCGDPDYAASHPDCHCGDDGICNKDCKYDPDCCRDPYCEPYCPGYGYPHCVEAAGTCVVTRTNPANTDKVFVNDPVTFQANVIGGDVPAGYKWYCNGNEDAVAGERASTQRTDQQICEYPKKGTYNPLAKFKDSAGKEHNCDNVVGTGITVGERPAANPPSDNNGNGNSNGNGNDNRGKVKIGI